jgi:predicted ester cyclase
VAVPESRSSVRSRLSLSTCNRSVATHVTASLSRGLSQKRPEVKEFVSANKRTVREFWSTWDAGDPNFWNTITYDYRNNIAGLTRPVTRDRMQNFNKYCYAALPTRRHDIIDMIADGDIVSCRATFTAITSGAYAPPGTADREIAIDVIAWFRVVSGKVAEEWLAATMRAQRGMPEGEPLATCFRLAMRE